MKRNPHQRIHVSEPYEGMSSYVKRPAIFSLNRRYQLISCATVAKTNPTRYIIFARDVKTGDYVALYHYSPSLHKKVEDLLNSRGSGTVFHLEFRPRGRVSPYVVKVEEESP